MKMIFKDDVADCVDGDDNYDDEDYDSDGGSADDNIR